MSGGYGTDALETVVVTSSSAGAAAANSPAEICSIALRLLGTDAINSLDDPTDRARICKQIWPMVLDDELTLHRWKCARKRAELARLADAPAFGFAYQYELPPDCLLVLGMSYSSIAYEIEDGKLLTDESTAKIYYLYRNETVAKYSPGLKSALAARMTAELAMPITKKKAIVDSAWAAYWAKVSQAAAVDGQQGTPEVLEDTTFVDARS
jgi:hypothetical protein